MKHENAGKNSPGCCASEVHSDVGNPTQGNSSFSKYVMYWSKNSGWGLEDFASCKQGITKLGGGSKLTSARAAVCCKYSFELFKARKYVGIIRCSMTSRSNRSHEAETALRIWFWDELDQASQISRAAVSNKTFRFRCEMALICRGVTRWVSKVSSRLRCAKQKESASASE